MEPIYGYKHMTEEEEQKARTRRLRRRSTAGKRHQGQAAARKAMAIGLVKERAARKNAIDADRAYKIAAPNGYPARLCSLSNSPPAQLLCLP